ncbi:alpha-L-rhamnosidase N-terminal domain-containing protein [Streptomyces sp. NPDC005402]|uniref:alpha-L-rhamnosidase N-terminal domain-containing protein n=1 Tax=Streptomyces sp. NPDC005402 TaxID=3155338 RepID=UPI0033BEC5A1
MPVRGPRSRYAKVTPSAVTVRVCAFLYDVTRSPCVSRALTVVPFDARVTATMRPASASSQVDTERFPGLPAAAAVRSRRSEEAQEVGTLLDQVLNDPTIEVWPYFHGGASGRVERDAQRRNHRFRRASRRTVQRTTRAGAAADLRRQRETPVVADESSTSGPGPVTADDLYDGQDIDARREDHAWLRPGFQDEPGLSPHRRLRQRPPQPRPRAAGMAHSPLARAADLAQRLRCPSPRLQTEQRGPAHKVRAHGVAGTVIAARRAEVTEDGECAHGPGIRPWQPTDSP